ncbi:MAG: hypothetical protein ACTSXP_10335 [Promethearchaeota archaeon]
MVIDIPDPIEVYTVHETGEYSKREDINFDNLEEHLKADEVFLILYPDIRRLYIWKGRKAPVTKKFISSRVAAKIQKECVRNAGMQHKIVSIDQDDELDEFITNLNIKSAKTQAERREEEKRKAEEEARRFEELMKKPDIVKEETKLESNVVKASSYVTDFMKRVKRPAGAGSFVTMVQQPARTEMSLKEKQEILDRIIKEKPIDGYQREHLILDQMLYVNMKKKAIIFDKETEIETWDEFTGALDDGFIDIKNRALRLHVKDKKIQVVEIFKPIIEKTPKDLNATESDNSNDV